ncbi:MAG: glycosyltransferase family 4 protein [Chloroflexi bacterium]|nr:glycosyltransferase family 4 protein [Chloroflexota bacterium]
MRMLAATGIFHPEPGGPSTYLRAFLPEWQARGHEAQVLTFGEGPVDIYPYPVSRVSRRGPYPLRQWRYFERARQLWPDHNFAFVHSLGVPLPRSLHPRVGKVVGDQAWERAMNRSWVPPDTDVDDFQTASYQNPLIDVSRRIRSRRAQNYDHVIVPSEYLKRMVQGWGVPEERITVIYNALNHGGESVAGAHLPEGFPASEGPVVLAVARFTPWKNLHMIIQAVARLPDVTLIIAGDGPLHASLVAQIEQHALGERVHLVGRIPREYMPGVYQSVDMTVLYSSYEGLSHVLLESLQAGTPVVASDKGGNPEVVRHEENGLLVPYPSVEALTVSIQQALDQHDRLAAGTHIGMERFSWEHMVEQTIALLEQF